MEVRRAEVNALYRSLNLIVEVNINFWLSMWIPAAPDNIQQGIVKVRLRRNTELKERLKSMQRKINFLFEKEMLQFDIGAEMAEYLKEEDDLKWDVECEKVWCDEIEEIVMPTDGPSEEEDSEEENTGRSDGNEQYLDEDQAADDA